MENVKELIKDIKTNLSQVSSSQKDEVRIMRAMLNDKDFEVDIYEKEGKVGTYCPAKDVRNMISNVISSTAKITNEEASMLVENYEFKKSDAETFVNVSKEFVNTYLQSGRKLPLGGREKSNVSLVLKDVKEQARRFPRKVGVNPDGTAKYDNGVVNVGSYESIKVIAPCPSWVNK